MRVHYPPLRRQRVLPSRRTHREEQGKAGDYVTISQILPEVDVEL